MVNDQEDSKRGEQGDATSGVKDVYKARRFKRILPQQLDMEEDTTDKDKCLTPSKGSFLTSEKVGVAGELSAVASPGKRGPGRPLGSLNKPKTPDTNYSPRRSRRLSGQDPED